MSPNEPTSATDESTLAMDESPLATVESTATNGATRRDAMEQATDDATSPVKLTRRGAMQTTAGLSAAALGLGAGFSGTGAGNVAEFDTLTVSDDNRIVDEDGETFRLRGVNIPDPRRLHRTRHIRGKTPTQIVDLITNNAAGWHPRVVRVPAQPADIGEHPMGHTGPAYEDGELENPDAVADDRRKMNPPQPVAFEREELVEYLEEYYDPVVDRCRERGVYCIVDYHRHWHEQPPGQESPGNAENHLPYSSQYTNYWAYNTYDDGEISFGEDAPASWGWVDNRFFEGVENGHADWDYVATEEDVAGTPYEYEHWQVNEALLEEALLFWEVVAERYGDEPHVIFEPYNEPTEPGIWGPADGCGAIKQQPLWDTYLDEFVGPILEEIRTHYDGLLLVGVPSWCQSVQGLHWRDFDDAGFDDVAVTWHNYAGHDVSQMHNWFNDTDYNSPEAVEAETGESLDNPYLPPPDSVDDQDCWGWEGYEAAGLQNAMDHHPIAVTEFGWIDDPAVTDGLRGSTSSSGRTSAPAYGEPFLDAIEADERISWVAWCADVRWLPTMFEFPDGPDEGDLEDSIENGNFYDPDFEDLPQPCAELPCEWELLDDPDSGQFLKDRLAGLSEDSVPFETVPHGDEGCDASGTVDGQTVCDVNGDDQYRDVNADGELSQADVADFFEVQHREAWKRDGFDFSGNGEVGHGDVVALFEDVVTGSA